jgi:hypothetical protein
MPCAAHALDHMVLLDLRHRGGADRGWSFGFSALGGPDALRRGRLPDVRPGLAAGRALGDLWGRRRDDAGVLLRHRRVGRCWRGHAGRLAAGGGADALLGAFSAIYHPVGIPMLVQHARNPGAVHRHERARGNLGIAVAAMLTGLLVQYWRLARGLRRAGAAVASRWACCSCLRGAAESAAGPAQAPPPGRSCRRASWRGCCSVMTLALGHRRACCSTSPPTATAS